jgi:hypothetical protein
VRLLRHRADGVELLAGDEVALASPNTVRHSPKARLVVTMIEVRS